MGWIQTRPIGKILRWATSPCSVPPSIWIETAVPAVLGMIWSVFEPDAKVFIELTTGHSWLCHYKRTLNGAHSLASDGDPVPATQHLFRTLAWLDLTAWWFFVFDVAAEGLANWTSGIMHTSGCRAGGAQAYGDQCVAGGVADGIPEYGPGWRAADWPVTAQAGPGIKIAPGGSGFIGGSCTVVNIDGIPCPGGLGIFTREYGNWVTMDSQHGTADGKLHTPKVFWYQRNNTVDDIEVGLVIWATTPGPIPRFFGDGGYGASAVYPP